LQKQETIYFNIGIDQDKGRTGCIRMWRQILGSTLRICFMDIGMNQAFHTRESTGFICVMALTATVYNLLQ